MLPTEMNIDVVATTSADLYSKRFPNVSPVLRDAMSSVELALAEKMTTIQKLGVDSGTSEMRAELNDVQKIAEVARVLLKVLESNEERLRS